jgi:cobyrinic acid a,c-diamide synthase
LGLFDGRSPASLEGSAAEVALWLGAPVLLVVDASGMARTAAAVVEGLARHVPGVRVAGVVFNRAPHGQLLREAMAPTGIPVLGALPERPDLSVPERHLGLVSGELAATPGWVEAMAAWGAAHLDLDAILALARVAPAVSPAPPLACTGRRVRLAIARDAAFHFYYEDNLELLAEAGADLVPFSPLADAALPPCDGLYLGGGYPEAHADALSANASMRASIRAFRGPIYAECGGFMYLGEALDERPMCGVLPVRTRMGPALRSFGYREVVTTADTVLGPAGTRFRGHEFHYSELVSPPPLSPAYRATGWSGEGEEGWGDGRVLGSYVHAHFGSNPALAAHFVEACRGALTAPA